MTKDLSKEETERYWIEPRTSQPEKYLMGEVRSIYLFDIISKYTNCNIDSSVLEVGCNVGRNLEYLRRKDFIDLSGMDINPDVENLRMQRYPYLYKAMKYHYGPAEDVLPKLTEQYDLIYSMAVLMHMYPGIFPTIVNEISRLCKGFLITIEDEETLWIHQTPWDYKAIFGPLGFVQVYKERPKNIKGLKNGYITRVFKKEPIG